MAQKGYIKNSLTKDLGAPEMANMFQGIFGASGIMSLYENLACVKVDNNTVRMSAGAYNLSGHLLGIAKGTTEDLTIDSGTSGQNRNDLIVAEFVRNGGGLGVDTLHFAVVKGASTSGTAADPALTQQDINAAGVTRQEALYRVKVTGTEITAVEKVAGSVSNLNLVELNLMPVSGSNANGSYTKFPDGTMICTKILDIPSILCTIASGTLFRNEYNATPLGSMAETFIAPPLVFREISQAQGAYNAWPTSNISSGVTTNNFGYLHVATIVATSLTGVKVFLKAIGRWK